jgi:hypothetical protein
MLLIEVCRMSISVKCFHFFFFFFFFFFQLFKHQRMFSFLRRRAFASAAGVSATGKQQQALKGDIVSAALQSVSNLDPATAAEAARRKVAVSRQVALPISAIKLRWVANQVRGLPYHAAVAQMQLSARRKA